MAPTPRSATKSKRERAYVMDEWVAEFIKRAVIRMTFAEIMPTLKAWGFLAEKDLQSLTLRQVKDNLAMDVVHLCERKKATMDHAADLDIVYNHAKSNKKNWDVYQMSVQTDPEMNLGDVSKFKATFKKTVRSILKSVTIHFREFGDSLWIRIAWGKDGRLPNQYRPTFLVYHIQTPYVFIAILPKAQRPVIAQAFLLATGYSNFQEMQLKSRCLESLMDIVFKRFTQPFQSYQPRAPTEKHFTPAAVDPHASYKTIKEKERVNRVTLETFGDGPLPKLQSASYKLETSFVGENGVANKIDCFQCLVKFSSPHLMESIRSLAPSGLADAPISSLLTCIPHKARNIFKISEKKQPSSSQAVH